MLGTHAWLDVIVLFLLPPRPLVAVRKVFPPSENEQAMDAMPFAICTTKEDTY